MPLERITYQSASHEFEDAWKQGVDALERIDKSIAKMLKALEAEKMPRGKAIDKMVKDHKHLQGFSRRTIYRALGEDDKRPYKKPELAAATNVPSGTIEKSQETVPKAEIIDISPSDAEALMPHIVAAALPYEVEASGEWLGHNWMKLKTAGMGRIKGYFSIYNGEIVGFESVSERRNKKVKAVAL